MLAIKVHMLQLCEKGRPHPGWQLSRRPRATGQLLVEEVRDAALGRSIREARLLTFDAGGTDKGIDPLPPLFDTVLSWIKPDLLALTGFERVDDADYAQTWLVSLNPADDASSA